MVSLSPLVRLVSQKVHNQYDDDDGRFTIRANSTIPSSLRQSAKVIFDTGASVHIANTESYMQRKLTPNTSFSVVGVNGAKDKAACSHIGGLSMSIRAYTYTTTSRASSGLTEGATVAKMH